MLAESLYQAPCAGPRPVRAGGFAERLEPCYAPWAPARHAIRDVASHCFR